MKSGLQKLLFLCGALCLIYYLGCGLTIRFDTAQLWLWLALSAGCFGLDFLIWLFRKLNWRLPRWLRAGLWTAFGLCAAFALGMMALVASHMGDQAPPGVDYMVVLGARVNGDSPETAEASGALLHRAESAAAYAAGNPNTLFIASGGQGEDEPISEAECIRRLLTGMGVEESRVLVEDRSTTTQENMAFSRALLSNPDASVAVVTNNFHVYRSGRLADFAFSGPVYTQSAEFTWILLPHYLVREAVCSVIDALEGHMTLW